MPRISPDLVYVSNTTTCRCRQGEESRGGERQKLHLSMRGLVEYPHVTFFSFCIPLAIDPHLTSALGHFSILAHLFSYLLPTWHTLLYTAFSYRLPVLNPINTMPLRL